MRDLSEKWRYLTRFIDLEKVEIPIYNARGKGKIIPLMKTLYSNICKNECLYCPFRKQMNIERGSWKADKLVKAALTLYREGRVKGIFLSSSVFSDPDVVVEREVEVAKSLREKGFMGYIHLRLMPGTDKFLIKEAAKYADRIGINLEAPSRESFEEIAPDKGSYNVDIFKRLEYAAWIAKRLNRRVSVDSQLIYWEKLGNDMEYLSLTEKLYTLGLRRVYFSPFRPIKGTPLENENKESPERVYLIYKASFLLRDYRIRLDQLKCIFDERGNIIHRDPKVILAENLDIFPLDVKSASYNELLLVPGIGPKSAKEIIKLKYEGKLSIKSLKRILGTRFKKAKCYLKL